MTDFDDVSGSPAMSIEELRSLGASYAQALLHARLFPVIFLAPIFVNAGVSQDRRACTELGGVGRRQFGAWRWINLTGRISPDAATEIRLEAEKGLQMMLSNVPAHGFPHIFLTRVPFWQRFDEIIQVGPLSPPKVPPPSCADNGGEKGKHTAFVPGQEQLSVEASWEWALARTDCPDWTTHIRSRAQEMLCRALGCRAVLVRSHVLTSAARFVGGRSSQRHREQQQSRLSMGRLATEARKVPPMRPERGWGDLCWGLEEDGDVGWHRCWGNGSALANYRSGGGSVVTVGVLLSPFCSENSVDRGPAAHNEKPARAFRVFWGQRAELRRFKDGSVVEAVRWDRGCSDGFRSRIICEISEHVLRVHHPFALPLSPHSDPLRDSFVRSMCGQLDLFSNEKAMQLGAEASLTRLRASFDGLVRMLQEISGSSGAPESCSRLHLPLSVKSVKAPNPAFRCTAPAPYCAPPSNEGLSNAFDTFSSHHAKVTLVDRIDVVLQFESSKSWPSELQAITAAKTAFYIRIAELFEQSMPWRCIVTRNFLDVLIDNCAFRIHIRHDRERELLSFGAKVRAPV